MAVTPRSDHVAVLTGSTLYVWGGCQYADGEELALPSDEIWIYDMDSGLWAHRGMGGEVPPRLSRTCGSFLQGVLYIFGGCDGGGQMYRVDLQDGKFTWRQMRARVGNLPSPRDRHSCWVYKERLIYFGGYGCKTVSEVNNVKSFTVNETSWSTAGGMLFRFWGWNSEVHVFEPNTATWTEPHTQGWPPEPRSSHASACLDSRGYVCGGLERQTIDIHCLDLVTWTWTHIIPMSALLPVGRSLHTLTPTSSSTLFLFGGLSSSGQVLSDGWDFDTATGEWRERQHLHTDKPRLWHSAAQGKDSEVVVFGGSCDYVLIMDSVMVVRPPSRSHRSDVLMFQTQPYSLSRLCEDCIGRNACALEEHVSRLPPRLQEKLHKRMVYFKTPVTPDQSRLT
ncbi:kelch domain-containing protein 1-like isoform X2 [Brachyhypopomus gauderio]|uniref:kelch domain-containing protein 1-like isoform X2 n=1 Tax=Brachyhypopomus gauderio TaxID=698409 RepID=UPI00404285A4